MHFLQHIFSTFASCFLANVEFQMFQILIFLFITLKQGQLLQYRQRQYKIQISMIQIGSQPIARNFVAPIFSRSFCISYLCYILILIIPATILINLNYSWPEYTRQLIMPTLMYQGYQLNCMSQNGNTYLLTNIQSQILNSVKVGGVSVGIQNGILIIKGQVVVAGLKACSGLIFFDAKLGKSLQVLTNLPINFMVTSQSNFLSSANIKGTVSLKTSNYISQSYMLTTNQTELGTYPYSYSSIFRDSAAKTATLISKTFSNAVNSQSTSQPHFTFNAQYKIESQVYMRQASLIEKLRIFIPIFMYLCLFLWWIIVNPLIQWMLVNRVYSAKPVPEKIKVQ